jgi:hypothetical protein
MNLSPDLQYASSCMKNQKNKIAWMARQKNSRLEREAGVWGIS